MYKEIELVKCLMKLVHYGEEEKFFKGIDILSKDACPTTLNELKRFKFIYTHLKKNKDDANKTCDFIQRLINTNLKDIETICMIQYSGVNIEASMSSLDENSSDMSSASYLDHSNHFKFLYDLREVARSA